MDVGCINARVLKVHHIIAIALSVWCLHVNKRHSIAIQVRQVCSCVLVTRL